MNWKLGFVALLTSTLSFAQTSNDTVKTAEHEIQEVKIIAKKPTVETKVDRTVFNVAESSILAGNTSWEILRMTPLVSIDNNDVIKSEGENVTVYINDRKSVFTGKELKEYLKSIPADNLMKIEVITNPSSRYETTGQVINIVLKKRDDEGVKGSASFTNRQSKKNNQYANVNLNYHKKNFTQTFSGSYGESTNINSNTRDEFYYDKNKITNRSTETVRKNKMPSLSSTSELELNDKNNIGVIFEFFNNKNVTETGSEGQTFENDIFSNSFTQSQLSNGKYNSLGSNLFYKFYDKTKNKIFDVSAGVNYSGDSSVGNFDKTTLVGASTNHLNSRLFDDSQQRNYYLKLDYSQPLDTLGSSIEFGGKMDFNNNTSPYRYENVLGKSGSSFFQYKDNINAVYGNYSTKLFKKLETRVGLRYEYITINLHETSTNSERDISYGKLMPNALLKYTFNPNFNLSASYNYSLWRPWYSEFNPFIMPSDDGTYSSGNMNLNPNPYHRFNFKAGIYKKYFLSLGYSVTNSDYWGNFIDGENGLISFPDNYEGRSARYSANFNTNQTFFSNKLNVNLSLGLNYTDNSDFNARNKINTDSYLTNFGGSANFSYTNLFNKKINISGWVGAETQNWGNTQGNTMNVFHNLSVTKVFDTLGLETTIQLNNIFKRPVFDNTTFTQIGRFHNISKSDWYGAALTITKRFGNQKVKENTKTDVEKNSGGAK